jgi:hypothetical protein
MPDFRCLNIYGLLIPSKASMEAVSATMDTNSLDLFLEQHDKWFESETKILYFKYNPVVATNDYEKTILQLVENDDWLIERFINSGIDYDSFKLLIQFQFVMRWHESLRGNFTGFDAQKHKRAATSLIKILKNKDPDDLAQKLIDHDSPQSEVNKKLIEYWDINTYLLATEYSIAFSYVELCHHQLGLLEKNNLQEGEIINQFKQLLFLSKDTFSSAEAMGRKQSGDIYLFQCPFCRAVSKFPSRKKPSHCGSCGKDYKAAWDKGSGKYVKKTTRADAGWVVAFDGKTRKCFGVLCDEQGGRWREVNNQVICFDCYQKINLKS